MISTHQLGICLALFPLGAFVAACSDSDDSAFASSPETTARVGQEYSYAIATRGGSNRVITAVEIPQWLALTDNGDGTGLLRGIPTPVDTGTHHVDLRLDVGGRSSNQAFDIEVQSDFVQVAENDEFEGDDLEDIWRFYDPRGSSTLVIADGTAQISVPGGIPHDMWRGNDNQAPRLLQAVEDRDFGVEAKFDSIPEERFQIQGIVAQEQDDKLIRLDLHHNGTSLRVYAAYIDGRNARVRVNRSIEGPVPNQLRVLRNGEFWTLQYSADGEDWRVASAFSQPLVVNEIGLFVGNARGVNSPAFTGVIDYFRNTDLTSLPEIDLPDGPDVQPGSDNEGGGGSGNGDDDGDDDNGDGDDEVEPPDVDTPDDDGDEEVEPPDPGDGDDGDGEDVEDDG